MSEGRQGVRQGRTGKRPDECDPTDHDNEQEEYLPPPVASTASRGCMTIWLIDVWSSHRADPASQSTTSAPILNAGDVRRGRM